ncbi:hypothetical protein DVH24_035438 [Malus domestica]|uniref:Uncharacterized protein n=1 Tax=Malus domestica TaxID=3750 RepID=A0A498J962_MALDO|nr:hypothetical protein DVH24_035438 [Malus domestica]
MKLCQRIVKNFCGMLSMAAGCLRVKPNGHTRSTSSSCCLRVDLKIRNICEGVLRVVPHR